jgi:hypothetical protein
MTCVHMMGELRLSRLGPHLGIVLTRASTPTFSVSISVAA